MVSIDTLIGKLPRYRDEWIVVNERQTVKDIIVEVLEAHDEFRTYYDKIALYFDGESIDEICDKLYRFCKKNIRYKEESEDDQTTSIPTGILLRGYGDCKHYSSFTGGILDALNRRGRKIKWAYRFASYKILSKTPHHVFIVVNNNGRELWIDPTPGSSSMQPVWIIDKKVTMAIRRNIAGMGDVYAPASELSDYDLLRQIGLINESGEIIPELESGSDENLSDKFIQDLQMLLHYGVIDDAGNVNDTRLINLGSQLPAEEYQRLTNAWQNIQEASIGGFFQDVWRGIKKVTLAIPRNAYLSIVALNVFGTATKLKQATSTESGKKAIYDKWYSLGGTPEKLQNAINSGSKKKRIGSRIGAAPALPAWVAVATAIIAALTPIVNAVLAKQRAEGMIPTEGWDPSLMDPAYNLPGATTGSDPLSFIKQNPLLVAGIVVAGYLLLKKK